MKNDISKMRDELTVKTIKYIDSRKGLMRLELDASEDQREFFLTAYDKEAARTNLPGDRNIFLKYILHPKICSHNVEVGMKFGDVLP